MNNWIDNFIKGPITSILGLCLLVAAFIGWWEYDLTNWEAGAIGIIGFAFIFMKDKLPGAAEEFWKAVLEKFRGGPKPPTAMILLFVLASVTSFAQVNGEFQAIRLTNGDSIKAKTANGTIFYNRVSNKFRFRENGIWKSIGTGSGTSSGSGGVNTFQPNIQTGPNYNAVIGDTIRITYMRSLSAQTFTVNAGIFPVGALLSIRQDSIGTTTLTKGPGVDFINYSSGYTLTPGQIVNLHQRELNKWSVFKSDASGGTVTSVTSANSDATVATGTTTPVITIVSAPKFTTGRTIGMTGDVTYSSPSFDGSGNVTAAGTLATVNSNVGSFGSATQSLTVTYNAKGLATAVVAQTVTPAATSVTVTPAGSIGSTNAGAALNELDTEKASLTGTETLTNKRINPRVQAVTSSATVTPSADNDDAVKITAQAAGLTLANPSGTPAAMQALVIRIKDNGTARAISFGSQYRGIGIVLPTTTFVSKTMYLGLIWNAEDSKWDVIGYSLEP